MVCGESLEIGCLWADRTNFGAEDDSIDKNAYSFSAITDEIDTMISVKISTS